MAAAFWPYLARLTSLRERIDYALNALQKYGAALKSVRATIDLSQAEFANGI